MAIHESDIDFALRVFFDREHLNDEQVDAWMREPEHVALLKEIGAIRYKYVGSLLEMDEKKEYEHLQQVIAVHYKKRRLFAYKWWAAASVVLVVGILAGYFWSGSHHEIMDSQLAGQKIALREHRIELVLANGETVELGKEKQAVKGVYESGIQNDSTGKLSYADVKVAGEKEGEILYNTLKIPTCGFYCLELEDSTRIWLNAETELRYPVAFGKNTREVYLSGEAYFEVSYDKNRPFVVRTGEGISVKVYGTRFNVNTYDVERVQTTLVQGKVGVELLKGEEYVLSPDEMAEYSKSTRKVEIKEVDTYLYTAWKDGKFVFENETMEEIMERLCRWYDCEVFFATERGRQSRFTGIITRFEQLSDVLYLIGETTEVDFEIKGNTIVIK